MYPSTITTVLATVLLLTSTATAAAVSISPAPVDHTIATQCGGQKFTFTYGLGAGACVVKSVSTPSAASFTCQKVAKVGQVCNISPAASKTAGAQKEPLLKVLLSSAVDCGSAVQMTCQVPGA